MSSILICPRQKQPAVLWGGGLFYYLRLFRLNQLKEAVGNAHRFF